MRLISVIFGTPSMNERAGQTRTLLAWGFANFETAMFNLQTKFCKSKSMVW
jgi:D-alanyl-D-alanine carboxypeptidase (penicillin-binding protein 5/6)